ncbi:peptidoglycan-binding domain-containing protein [Leifsonia flava]|nr:peptidoglycan-binding domain-containing protein [Leifsonia flava]
MIEVSTDLDLLDSANQDQRSSQNYFFGGQTEGSFAATASWTMPQEVWDRLGQAERIYYRLYTSEDDADFVDWTVSVQDASSAETPFVLLGSGEAGASPLSEPSVDADVDALCRYLRISAEDFAVEMDRYFNRLGELLSFHQITRSADELNAASFRGAVSEFQKAVGLQVDGVPGEDTLWALNQDWAASRQLALERVAMDAWVPPGAQQHIPDEHGYESVRVRSDVVGAVEGLRADLNAVEVLMTSAGASRALDAAIRTGRSGTSIHYSGAAIDLATTSGMVSDQSANANNQLYVITDESGRWRVWARSEFGQDSTLDAVEWAEGRTSTRTVEGRFIDVTAAAERRGLQGIGPRSTFPGDYLSAEWWHLQSADALVPWASQFGSEVLSLATNSLSGFQAATGLWSARKRIFHRGKDGWW